ncbi:MAG: M56 family metallopeptidase [Planctomycetota bacterium]
MTADPSYFGLRLANALFTSFGDLIVITWLFGLLHLRAAALRRGLLAAAVLHGAVAFWGIAPLRVVAVDLAHDGQASWIGWAAPLDLGLAVTWVSVVTTLATRRVSRLWRLHRLLHGVGELGLAPASTRVAGRLAPLAARLKIPVPQQLALAGLASPFVVGLRRPVLVFPMGLAEDLTDAELDSVLAHELSHLRRGDLWVALLLEIVRTLHFFNWPLLLLIRRYELEVEILRDQEASRIMGTPRPLETSLCKVLSWSRSAAMPVCAGVAPLLSIGPRQVVARLRRLHGRRVGRVGVALQVLALAILAPCPNRWTGECVTVRRISTVVQSPSVSAEHSRVSVALGLTTNPIARGLSRWAVD